MLNILIGSPFENEQSEEPVTLRDGVQIFQTKTWHMMNGMYYLQSRLEACSQPTCVSSQTRWSKCIGCTDNVLKSNSCKNRNDIAGAANLKTFLDKSIFASVFIQRQWLGKPKSVN